MVELPRWMRLLLLPTVLVLTPAWGSQNESAPAAPSTTAPAPEIELAPAVQRLLADPVLSETQRRELALFHGQAQDLGDLSPREAALQALLHWDLQADLWQNAAVPVRWRAENALRQGDPATVLLLLAEDDGYPALLLRARALEWSGQMAEAIALATPVRARLHVQPPSSPGDLTAAGELLALLGRLEGEPARDYQAAMGMFAAARSTGDPLHWPAYVAEARLLAAKHNPSEAAQALQQALTLNPHSSAAWYELGLLSAGSYQFGRAEQCRLQLLKLQPDHPLALRLAVETALMQKTPAPAAAPLALLLTQTPRHPEVLALAAATAALRYDDAALAQALAAFDAVAPGHPLALATVGRYLSLARQYEAAERILRQALARAPRDADVHSELGLLLMQAGRDEAALEVLSAAATLDPFDLRVANQLALVRELLTYQRIETEHFVIRYMAGVDEVLARDMPAELERIYRDITSVFEHRPRRKTLVEIFPNERWFGVRITGMPDIWTIAASTGDVIALTPPRLGARQRGPFDWARVIRHEFVHTVTLDQTRNRLPHWFTEACAVSQEPGQRDYSACQLLADALHRDRLFDLQSINIAFVRPSSPTDRPQAYAQAAWMLQYITQAHGHRAVLGLLHAFRDGQDIDQACVKVLGVEPAAFMRSFKSWAQQQVRDWGMGPLPDDPQLRELLKTYAHSQTIDAPQLQALLAQYPDQPDLLGLAARQAVAQGDAQAAYRAVVRYAAARPVDPWPQEQLVLLAPAVGKAGEAVGALTELDSTDQSSGQWAFELAKLYQRLGELDYAREAARRALQRQPYSGSYRELAATIALQQGDLPAALRHVEGLALLEPDRAVHQLRLAALHQRAGNMEASRAAALRARQLDPQAQVERFLGTSGEQTGQ